MNLGTSFVSQSNRSQRRTKLLQRWGVNIMGTILLVILILLLLGALPTWPYSSGWGYYPSGGLGLVLVIIIVLLVMGRI
jgi:hypothetical protein